MQMLHGVASTTGGGGRWGVKREVGLRGSETNPFLGEKERGQRQIKGNEVDEAVTVQCLQHAASPDSHTLPAALGWKRTFGSRGRPRSPARGGKEALTECAAVPLCRPHRTSHLGRGVREHSPHHYQCDSSNWDQPLRSARSDWGTGSQPAPPVSRSRFILLTAYRFRKNLVLRSRWFSALK